MKNNEERWKTVKTGKTLWKMEREKAVKTRLQKSGQDFSFGLESFCNIQVIKKKKKNADNLKANLFFKT